jgi:hypothetical protein
MNASLGAELSLRPETCPPGTDSCQKVNAIGRLPAGKRQSDINCRCAGCESVALKFKHGEFDTVFSADLNDRIRTTAPRFYCTCSVERLSDEGISQHRLVWPGQ